MSSGTAVADKAYTLELENGSCLIDAHMFDKDALIFDDQIEKAGIAFPDGTPYVELICHGFDFTPTGLYASEDCKTLWDDSDTVLAEGDIDWS